MKKRRVPSVVKNGYYMCEEIAAYQLIKVMKITTQSVQFRVIRNTMYHQWPFLPGTTHEITKGTFLALFAHVPKIKGMLLDGVNNE